MTANTVVSDASPLIALEQIGQLHLLESLFRKIFIPPAVAREVAPTVTLPDWIEQQALVHAIGPLILSAALGAGESEAISLALEIRTGRVILDDRPARRLAQALHLPIIGTLGILLAAKQHRLLTAVQPCLDALLHYDFRIAPDLYRRILADAGESV